jgi:hypothetical protein
MIRRRGKRGRIRRAEANEAYENRTLLTNDAPGLSKKCLDEAAIPLISPTWRRPGISADLAKMLKAEPVKRPIFPTDKSPGP